MSPNRRRDTYAAIVFFLLGVASVLFLIPKGVTVPSTVKIAALSPDFWPKVISFATIAASVFLLVEALTMEQPVLDEKEDEEASQYQLDTLPSLLRVLVLIVALFVFYFSLATLGVVAASILLLGAMMLYFGERNYLLIAVLSFGVPILLYLFFRYVASVPIPLGMFGP
ncbi:MAG: tripartite tricarboxylate transporter TctB family protein [Albidovulum sp.]